MGHIKRGQKSYPGKLKKIWANKKRAKVKSPTQGLHNFLFASSWRFGTLPPSPIYVWSHNTMIDHIADFTYLAAFLAILPSNMRCLRMYAWSTSWNAFVAPLVARSPYANNCSGCKGCCSVVKVFQLQVTSWNMIPILIHDCLGIIFGPPQQRVFSICIKEIYSGTRQMKMMALYNGLVSIDRISSKSVGLT